MDEGAGVGLVRSYGQAVSRKGGFVFVFEMGRIGIGVDSDGGYKVRSGDSSHGTRRVRRAARTPDCATPP